MLVISSTASRWASDASSLAGTVISAELIVAAGAWSRPTGVGRAIATDDMPIEGRDEWLAAAKRLA
jgi:hypothetical protein